MIKALLRISLRVLPFIAVALVILELVVTNQLAVMGEKVKDAEARIDLLRTENELLSEQIASASALLTIASKAQSLGFVKPASTVNLAPEQFPVALNQPH